MPKRIYLSPAKAQPKLGLSRAELGKTQPKLQAYTVAYAVVLLM
jgi:hypothetical protein